MEVEQESSIMGHRGRNTHSKVGEAPPLHGYQSAANANMFGEWNANLQE